MKRKLCIPVRNSVKAIIIRDNKLLCIKKSDSVGDYYLLPGGGQNKDETFEETVKRECCEELGAKISVNNLRYIREYIAKNHEFKETDNSHQVDFMFSCDLLTKPDFESAHEKDDGQSGIEWIDLAKSDEYRIYPKELLNRINSKFEEVYWGDIN